MSRERRRLKVKATEGRSQVAVYTTAKGEGQHGWTMIEEADFDLKVYEHVAQSARETDDLPGAFEDCMAIIIALPPPADGEKPDPETIAAVQRAIDEVLRP